MMKITMTLLALSCMAVPLGGQDGQRSKDALHTENWKNISASFSPLETYKHKP